ncbi:MAG: gamma carbonic anhydrase family protein [Alphaproteobacteria bacterium CG_4_10_14_0_8_um_filter_53_9]|nr:MAG: gamma carbonic anhydrase family protein [Alphaproteobacteria bacterium CG_4_10_14_0_8_um_filter_53_9]
MQAHIAPYQGKHPQIDATAKIAPTAVITGDTHIGAGSSIWYGTTLRGDVHFIRIGAQTNLQEGVVGHVTMGKFPLIIGNRVTIGHRAVVHGCVIEDQSLVGMGAVVLDGAVVQTGAMVAAGAVVGPGKVVETGWLWAGVPARPVRELTEEEKMYLSWSADHYVTVANNTF